MAFALDREHLTPRMLRLTLNGPDLEGFHSYQADDHVKIVFPDDHGTFRPPTRNDKQLLDWPHPTPTTRDYTVRSHAPRTWLVVEADDPAEHDYPLPDRENVKVIRLVAPRPTGTFLFAAGEATDLKPLPSWPKDLASITGYWKRGVAGLERE